MRSSVHGCRQGRLAPTRHGPTCRARRCGSRLSDSSFLIRGSQFFPPFRDFCAQVVDRLRQKVRDLFANAFNSRSNPSARSSWSLPLLRVFGPVRMRDPRDRCPRTPLVSRSSPRTRSDRTCDRGTANIAPWRTHERVEYAGDNVVAVEIADAALSRRCPPALRSDRRSHGPAARETCRDDAVRFVWPEHVAGDLFLHESVPYGLSSLNER
jgi:hypothetical protein